MRVRWASATASRHLSDRPGERLIVCHLVWRLWDRTRQRRPHVEEDAVDIACRCRGAVGIVPILHGGSTFEAIATGIVGVERDRVGAVDGTIMKGAAIRSIIPSPASR